MRETMLRIVLLATMIFAFSAVIAFAETETELRTYHRLDTGVTFLWSNSAGVWQNGLAPGDTTTFSQTFSLPVNARNVKVAAYNPAASAGGIGYFDFRGGKYYAWNRTAAAVNGDEYNINYYAYAADPLIAVGAETYNAQTGSLRVTYTMTFRAAFGQPYNLKAKLAAGEKSEVYALLGNPSAEIVEKMRLLDPASESYNPNVEGYLFFMPIVMSYDMEEPKPAPEEEPEKPEDEQVLQGEARLSVVPAAVYEGHTAEAQDISTFIVDDVIYNAARMYSEGLAYANISPEPTSGAKDVKTGPVTADITFPKVGDYKVNLNIRMKNGMYLRDEQYVEVRATPDIAVSLGGTQKQNRKQLLNIRVYTHPDRALETLYVDLQTASGSQKVRLVHCVDNPQSNEKTNTGEIKTRPIELISSSPYFTEVSLPFLTKNEEEKQYKYHIYAEDCEGNGTTAAGTFTVRADLPPNPIVMTAQEHIREEAGNLAHIDVSDAGSTDGDAAERRWFVRVDTDDTWREAAEIPGIEDTSFGTMKSFRHEKEGVGKVAYKLVVTDRWTEETLEEYIDQDDYLSAEAYGETDVINIAPKVSLAPLATEKAELLMIARTPEEALTFRRAAERAEIALIEEGVDADITVSALNPIKTSRAAIDEPTAIQTFSTSAFGWAGENTCLEKEWYLADRERFYTIEGTWEMTKPTPPYLAAPKQPAFLSAYDLQSGNLLWRNEIGAEEFNMSGFGHDFVLAQDDKGEFLLLGSGAKTRIYDKHAGAPLCTVDLAVGQDNYLRNKRIYTVKADGVYSINTTNGQIKKVYAGEICTSDGYCDKSGYSRLCNKKICFVARKGATLLKIAFDPITEETTAYELIPDIRISAPYTVIGFDSEGKLALGQRDKSMVFVFDADGKHMMTVSEAENARGRDTVCAFDGSGRFSHIVTTNNGYSSGSKTSTYRIKATAYPLDGGSPLTYENERRVSNYATSGNGTDAKRTVYAITDGNKVVLCTGDRATSISDGSSYGNYYWSSASQILFDFERRTTDRRLGGASFYDDLQIGGKISEYGKRSDDYCISAYSWGHAGYPYDTPVNGQSAKVAVLPESIDSMIARTIFANMSAAGERKSREQAALFMSDIEHVGALSLQALEKAKATLLTGADIEETIRNYFMRETKTQAVLKIVPQADDALISKTYELNPDTTYYFEYMTDGNKTAVPVVEINEASLLPEGMLGQKYYRVTEAYEEDFEDEETNRFFGDIERQRIVDGRYRAAFLDLDLGKGNNTRSRTDASGITITVPEGKKAILSFDYDVDLYGKEAWFSAHATIKHADGSVERWENFLPNDASGHYTHPRFLKEGTSTLEFYASDTSTRYFNAHFIIDNLSVRFVEYGGLSGVDAELAVRSSAVSDGQVRVSGSFKTPSSVIAYRERKTEYIEGPPGAAAYTSNKSMKHNSEEWSFAIPAGKRAAYVKFDTKSNPIVSGTREYDISYSAGGSNWKSSAQDKSPGDSYYNIGKEYRITLANVTGTQSFATSSTTANLKGKYTRVEAMLMSQADALTTQMKYFCADADADGKKEMYVASNVLQSVGLSIPIVENDVYISDFKLYYLEDGMKVYEKESDWQAHGCTVERENIPLQHEKSEPPMVYQKGETVRYGMTYSDYESDPSKREYWRYSHTPFNDGLHPEAGKILSESIGKFYTDGKYVVEHWQEDSTGRTDYDKLSNIARITFYIEGAGNAPWIESIRTVPAKVRAGAPFNIKVAVDDLEKDELTLETSFYKSGELICENTITGINANVAGSYPLLTGASVSGVEPGTYDVVCLVSDLTGVGIGEYRFRIEIMTGIRGMVSHTEQWEERRQNYNNRNPQNIRPEHYFWAGERFLLRAVVDGDATKVTAKIRGAERFRAALARTGTAEAGKAIYEGVIWDKEMASLWRDARGLPLTFEFTSEYADGVKEVHEVGVVVDNTEADFRIHRTE